MLTEIPLKMHSLVVNDESKALPFPWAAWKILLLCVAARGLLCQDQMTDWHPEVCRH